MKKLWFVNYKDGDEWSFEQFDNEEDAEAHIRDMKERDGIDYGDFIIYSGNMEKLIIQESLSFKLTIEKK